MKCFICGITGKIGKMLLSVNVPEIDIVGGMDSKGFYDADLIPIQNPPKFEVIIDFSHRSALNKVLSLAVNAKTPLLSATTGLDENDLSALQDAAKTIPILQISNTSRGISALKKILPQLNDSLSDWDCSIIEKHHKEKKDAPSGTAISLAQSLGGDNGATQIHSIRGGTLCGEHEIIFIGEDEEIKITHIAYNRKIFAIGALNAAKKLINLSNGLYTEI